IPRPAPLAPREEPGAPRGAPGDLERRLAPERRGALPPLSRGARRRHGRDPRAPLPALRAPAHRGLRRLMRSFQAGGTVREGSTYIERKADKEIVEALLEGEFCYVLAPRQIGKSSLRMRAQQTLKDQGVRCASIDLTSIGTSGISDEEWYFGLVEEISNQLDLGRDAADFW